MTKSLQRQRGNALLMVMILGATATFIAGSVLQYETAHESRAVSEYIAETRAYWAGMGQINYALSRIRNDKLCNKGGPVNCDTDQERYNTAQKYVDEVPVNIKTGAALAPAPPPPPGGGATITWTYPDLDNSSYFIKVQALASQESSSFNANSGHIKIVESFPTAGQSTLPILNGFSARLRPVEIRFCAVGNWNDPGCNNPSSSSSTDETNFVLIKAVDRPPLF